VAQTGTAGAAAAFGSARPAATAPGAPAQARAVPAGSTAGEATAAPGGGRDDAPQVDVARLRLAIGRLSRRLRRHQLAGLTPGQVAALSTVERSGPLRLSELAAIEGIAPSTLTRLVAALEERNYVQRCAVAGDARASELAITPAGREVLDRIRQESTAALAGSLASLQPAQLAALAAALPVIEQLADDSSGDGRAR
jgi:DNA-binding MarR family transcriptional regulator